jgi:hypothetical protein
LTMGRIEIPRASVRTARAVVPDPLLRFFNGVPILQPLFGF